MREATKTPKIFVALDFDSEKKALGLVSELSEFPLSYKVGMELGIATRFSIIEKLKAKGLEVFLDFKFYDIPETVKKASLMVCDLGVDYFTVHLSGGEKMIKESKAALVSRSQNHPKLLGVSVLTSFSEQEFKNTFETSQKVSIKNQVEHIIRQGAEWGMDGVVCSPHEVGFVTQNYPNLFSMIPGVRPEGSEASDQSRVMTPAKAVKAGACGLVIGRPITRADRPREVVKQILGSI